MVDVDNMTFSNSNVQILHCPDCFFMSLSSSRMCEHFFTHQESVEWQVFKCSVCGLISTHEDLLEEHLLLKHPESHQNFGKEMVIDSVFLPEVPDDYSIETELTPVNCYINNYKCPFCQAVQTDAEGFKIHLEICHNIYNVEKLTRFLSFTEQKRRILTKRLRISNSEENNFGSMQGFKKVKSEESMPMLGMVDIKPQNPIMVTTSNSSNIDGGTSNTFVNGPSTPQTSSSFMYSYNQMAEQLVAKHTLPSLTDPCKVIICPNDDELKMEVVRDILIHSYDPEPLRFLRHLVRAGIPLDELINFSWKGNRRGRPRHVTEIPTTVLSMNNNSCNVVSSSNSNIGGGGTSNVVVGSAGANAFQAVPRRSMKDDTRMRAFCCVVEKLTSKPLPENLGTHMHQFLSNLRNKIM